VTLAKAVICCALVLPLFAAAQTQVSAPPVWVKDQTTLLKSSDPRLAANKKLVFDMWRSIVQAGRTDLAPQFFTPGYIQHNPNVASGRDNLIAYIKATRPVRPIAAEITFPVVALMAEGDIVTLATVSYDDDPDNPGKRYAGTHFDMFRIENGKIAEHWDSVGKSKTNLKIDPNVTSKP
jgi:predicted SnoaL-like aldol condensation-catalyzing enzyme